MTTTCVRMLWRGLMAWGCLVWAVGSRAQDGKPTGTGDSEVADAVFDLGTVTVSAPLGDGGLQLGSTLSEKDLEKTDSKTVTEALNWVPGVNIGQVGARNEGQVFVRGFDLRQVPVFVDGVPVYVPYDGSMDVSRITLGDVSQITVDKGFSSILYGPNTMGGAINIVTKQPTKPFEGSVGFGMELDRYGDAPLFEERLTLGSRLEQVYGIVSLSNLKRNFFTLPDSYEETALEDGGRRTNSDTEDLRLMARIGITPNDTDDYSLTYAIRDAEKYVPPYNGTVSTPRYWRYTEWREQSLYYISTTRLSERLGLKLRAFYEQMDNTLDSYDNDSYTTQTKGYAFTSIYADYSFGGGAELAYDVTDTSVLKGMASFKRDVHREHNDGAETYYFEDQTASFGVEYTCQLAERLDFTTGVRYDLRRTLQAEDANTGTDFATDGANPWNWQAGFLYHLTDSFSAHATYSHTSRLPTLKDRFSYKFGKAIPNPDLDVETADNFELGIKGQPWAWLTVESAVFYHDINDMIQSIDLSSTTYQMQNIGKVRVIGWEVGGEASLTDSLAIGGCYTLLDRDNRTDDQKLTRVPDQHLGLYLSWFPISSLEVRPSLQAQTETYSSSDGLQKTAGFATVDLAFLYDLNESLSFQFGVRNLGDKLYEYDEGYPEAGRTFFLNASYTF